MKIVVASKNEGKIREIKALFNGLPIDLYSLDDYSNAPDIIEDGKSFFENALKKAKIISGYTGHVTLADDSGLEVDCLGGEPGIYSSRYSGDNASDGENIQKLLKKLEGTPLEKRRASFRCVLILYRPDATFGTFEGVWRGRISDKPVGNGGFGYDPIFYLPERGLTVAQLPQEIKNTLSHRAQALKLLKESLRETLCPEDQHAKNYVGA